MSRRAWRYLFATTLVLALAGLGLSLTRRSVRPSDLLGSSFLATNVLPELLQRIRNFHRVITREGRKVLEVSASEASYFKNDKAIEILEPKVIFYEGGERSGEVSAAKGRLYIGSPADESKDSSGTSSSASDGTDVQSVEVSGNVLFEIGRLVVTTENLTFDKASNHIHAPGEAHVEAAELSLTGTDMTVNMLERSVVIASGVKMTLRPKSEATP